MILQLNPSLPVVVTSKANATGYAYFMTEDRALWGVVLDVDGSVWWMPNDEIRVNDNWSLGRRLRNKESSAGDLPHSDGSCLHELVVVARLYRPDAVETHYKCHKCEIFHTTTNCIKPIGAKP